MSSSECTNLQESIISVKVTVVVISLHKSCVDTSGDVREKQRLYGNMSFTGSSW